MKLSELFENVISYYPEKLTDEYAIIEHINDVSDEPLSTHAEDNLLDRLRGCYATLELLPINTVETMGDVGSLSKTHPSVKKINKYSKLDPKTIPPIVVDNDLVIDGNHRLEAAKKMGLSQIYAYVVKEKLAEEVLDEASGRLFSGVRLDEIPPQYKNLKVLGRGTTTIAVEKDPNTVLLFTRDAMKREWLVQSWGLNLGQEIGSYASHKHTIRGVRELPIYILEMPKLYSLTLENKRIVASLMKEFEKIRHSAFNYADHSRKNAYTEYFLAAYQRLVEKYEDEFRSEHQLKTLVDFLANYSADQYGWDLGPRNFKQTANGELVVLDPIADAKLMDAWRESGGRAS